MKLPFGKYKGLDIADPDIPVAYFEWLEEQDWIKPELRKELQFEISRRRGDRPGAGRVVKAGRP